MVNEYLTKESRTLEKRATSINVARETLYPCAKKKKDVNSDFIPSIKVHAQPVVLNLWVITPMGVAYQIFTNYSYEVPVK